MAKFIKPETDVAKFNRNFYDLFADFGEGLVHVSSGPERVTRSSVRAYAARGIRTRVKPPLGERRGHALR